MDRLLFAREILLDVGSRLYVSGLFDRLTRRGLDRSTHAVLISLANIPQKKTAARRPAKRMPTSSAAKSARLTGQVRGRRFLAIAMPIWPIPKTATTEGSGISSNSVKTA